MSLHFKDEEGLAALSRLTGLEYLFLGDHVALGPPAVRALASLPRLLFLQVSSEVDCQEE